MFKILVVNIGSTSFKYQLFNMDEESYLAKGQFEKIGSKQSHMQYNKSLEPTITASIDTSSGYDSCIRSMLDMLLDSRNGVIENLSEIKAIGFKTVHAGEVRDPNSCVQERLCKW